MQTKKPSGYVIYRGPSLINGEPIVVVAITKSTNSKTGDMVQTYILADTGLSPVESAKLLLDAAVCGDCKHRRGLDGSCYVNLGQGPRAVYDGVLRGIYLNDPAAAAKAAAGRMVRLGTYGDPSAAPVDVWAALVADAEGWTGYTHQWRNALGMAVRDYCMASADTPAERDLARSLGFRTFRVRTTDQPTMSGEFQCPAAAESGKRKTCADCGACNGGVASRKADPVIVVHGSLAKRFAATVAA